MSQALAEAGYLVGVDDDDVRHRKECGKACKNLSPYSRASLGDLKKFVHW